ncbi:glycoside hydrolase TIM-barrel-like domain-containing protein [Aestuariibaculum sp. M13]|uniref:glycoside hydrolase family 113 n=1 Tax=Aestuariibaculum sp. M13 TaxID=2967132 RepID=UPI00215A0951|nr:glycoside hydrolase TIM-barrel-like domain-containing protein [Aestuariibaculum sp. M13]MCR8666700.1 glycoside hydrolase TIM-barrel-like domain-containing protein [Aestuariibaculum sp. M13]
MKCFIIIGLMVLLSSCDITSNANKKINGVSFVASRDSINNRHIKPVLELHANYVAIMPFGFIRNLEHPRITYNSNRQWFGETKEGVEQYVNAFKAKQFRVMVKPQIWVSRGEFTGKIKMNSEEAWKELEETYSKFILDFAKVAEEAKVELFCIGTELETFIDHRPEFWFELIKHIRKIYSGKLTYAANWNEYNRTPFWYALDYIGIDAYFPVSDLLTPTVEDCKQGWINYKADLEMFSENLKKPILFTEFGYRSVDYAGKRPWESDRQMNNVNLEAQLNATQALFETCWDEDWFAGGFLWKWHHKHETSGGNENFMFTPQNKPVEVFIKDWYARY